MTAADPTAAREAAATESRRPGAAPAMVRRPTCADCLRPVVRCVCAALPRVEPRTRVVIVQHPRERRHPFGTAHLVARALGNAELIIAWRHDQPLPFTADGGTWLLYPGPTSMPLDTALERSRPHTLVAVDGTWNTAPTLLRDHPAFASLPRVHLTGGIESRYRIRAEPAPGCLSTLEALVAALARIEPETRGLDALLGAFDAMVERQLALLDERAGHGLRTRAHPRPARAVPRALTEEYGRVVVVYAESVAKVPPEAGREAYRHAGRELLQWAAVRPATGAVFERILAPVQVHPEPFHLAHMELNAEALATGCAPTEVARDFNAFAGPDAVLVAWNQSTLDLARALLPHGLDPRILIGPPLKAIVANLTRQSPGKLESFVAGLDREGLEREGLDREGLDREGLGPEGLGGATVQGRAAARLVNALAVARWLHSRTRNE